MRITAHACFEFSHELWATIKRYADENRPGVVLWAVLRGKILRERGEKLIGG